MKIELRNVKIHKDMSEETECFSATVYADGKRVGTASNRGHGGCNEYYWEDKEAGALLEAYDEYLPEIPLSEDETEEWAKTLYPMKQDLDWFIMELMNRQETEKKLKRLSKKKTLFRLKADTYKAGEWLTLNVPYEGKIQEYLDRQYPDQVAEIYGQEGRSTPVPAQG